MPIDERLPELDLGGFGSIIENASSSRSADRLPPMDLSSGLESMMGRVNLGPRPVPGQADRSRAENILLEDLVKDKRLGAGQFGQVFKVKHKKTGKEYALKEIKDTSDPSAIEVDINMTMCCDQIVHCFQVYHGEHIRLLMEYMDAGTLKDLQFVYSLKNQTIPEPDLSQIAFQVLKALHYLHKERNPHVAHRDIKPTNLLLQFDHTVKIGDFGVSAVLEKTFEARQTFAGTQIYFPPERVPTLTDNPHKGVPAEPGDIWSVGITLLECVTGAFPYKIPSRHGRIDQFQLVKAIVMGPSPTAPEGCSPELRDFLAKSLVKDCHRRATADELLQHPFITMHKDHRLDLTCLKK